ncbi:MAG: hypothetical protein DHS20C18_08500 [Saprospiraceae bacterium]|nr:MAG: hypothetical protein DHS20C18_08500 [Saprospiraceae bacterium]
MKNLIEISRIVTKKKVKKIEIFDDYTLRHKNSKFNDFYNALTSNKFKNDRDAAAALYGCSPQDAKYRQLKSRFRKRILNTLFFLDINKPSNSSYNRAYYSCNRDWTLVKILLSNRAFHSAASMAKQILTIALKYRFSDIIVNCSRLLRDYCSNNKMDKDYEIYDGYIKEFSEILNAEIRSEELYQRVIMDYHKTSSRVDGLMERINTYCNTLVSLSEQFDSPIIHYNMFLVWCMRFEIEKGYDAMLQVCTQAEQYIEDNPVYYQKEKLITFYGKKMSAHLHMKDYKMGKINAEKCLTRLPEGSESWFIFMEYYLLLAIHTENYIHALAIFNRAISSSEFKKQDALIKEKWTIFEAYLKYIIDRQKFDPSMLQKAKRKVFRVSKFINNPLQYPKEYRIFTILSLILQVLFLIEQRNYTELEERIERLKQYADRKLKKDDYFRPIQFIRLLQMLRKAKYQIDELGNTHKYYNRLLEQPFFYRGALTELEIIPYEKLWEIVLDSLR